MLIKDIEMFKGLSNIELAKLLGNLEKQTFPIGTTIFEQDDSGNCMYIIERGKVEIYAKGLDGSLKVIATLTEGDSFGEMALLTGEARSATAIAVLDSNLYVIDEEIFNRLIAENSTIAPYFIKLLSQRLINTNNSLRDSKEKESQWVIQELAKLPENSVEIILWCASVPIVTSDLIFHTFKMDHSLMHADPVFRDFFDINNKDEEQYTIKPERRIILQELCVNQYGYSQINDWIERAIDVYQSLGEWGKVVQLFFELDRWKSVLDIINKHEEDMTKEDLFVAYNLFRYCPKEILAGYFKIIEGYVDYCFEHDLESGLAVLEKLLELEKSHYRPEQLLTLYEWAAQFSIKLNKKQQANNYIQMAEAMNLSSSNHKITEDRNYDIVQQKITRKKIELLTKSSSRLFQRNRMIEIFSILLALICILFFYTFEPVVGLSHNAMKFIGIAIAAVIFWIIDIIPDYIVSLGMVMVWVMSGIVPVDIALSGFATTTWIFMIFIMALSAAIIKSGILYRFSLNALKKFPSNYRGQLFGIVAGGIIMNPLIPSSNAKVTLGVPMARTLSESMGFKDKSSGAAGFGLAAMIFFGFIAPFVLTGSYTNIMAYGLASTEKMISWMQWFLYALPGLIIFTVMMLIILKRIIKNAPIIEKGVTSEVLNEQLNLLGPLTKEERLSLATVVICIGLMIFQPLHGVDNTWIMLLGFSFLVISGVLDRKTITTGIDWTFLIFLGVAFSFASITEELEISKVMSGFLAEHMAWSIASPTIFLLSVIVLSFLVTLIIRDDPAVILLVTALIPLGSELGLHPWILVFVILLATDPFFFKYQSPTYLNAYYSSEGKAFTHKQGQKVALGYAVAVILLVLVSIPYWKWLGLMP